MNNKRSTLKDAQLYEENGRYYLRLKYIIEDENRVKELEFHKVDLELDPLNAPDLEFTYGCFGEELCYITIGSISYPVRKTYNSEGRGTFYTVTTLEEKPAELTLSEIEKKLGYKIKIISEENNDQN